MKAKQDGKSDNVCNAGRLKVFKVVENEFSHVS